MKEAFSQYLYTLTPLHPFQGREQRGKSSLRWFYCLAFLFVNVYSNLAPGNMDVKTTTTCKVGKVFNIE